MQTFYQSELRKTITTQVYKKPSFTVDIAGVSYQGIVKVQRKLGRTFRWFMVHGVMLERIDTFIPALKESAEHLRRDYGKSVGDIFFQIGAINVIHTQPTRELKNPEVRAEILKKRTYHANDLKQRYGFVPSRREHMPTATIVLDLTKGEAGLHADLSESCRRYINKGKREQLTFEQATTDTEFEAYRELRYTMSFDKGFSVVSKESFVELMRYLTHHNAGTLRVARKGDQLVCGAVYLFWEKQLVYLYGATDRSFGHIGAQYRLTREIMCRGVKQQYTSLDLLGIMPTGVETHHLSGVTRFKQSFGGETIDYIGNYDLIFNNRLYKAFKMIKGS